MELVKSAVAEMVDTAPPEEIMSEIRRQALAVSGVRGVHDLRARYHGGEIYMEVHVVVDPELTVREGHAIAKAVEHRLVDYLSDVAKVTTHIDPD
jgi:divalent metal cation (Fe/Co/Zn/Cd) transporter